MAQKTMYPAINNSPVTSMIDAISAVAVSINLESTSFLPDPPNIATLGTGDEAELILYTTKSASNIGGISRGFNGTIAKAWPIGTSVYRAFTAYDHDAFKANIEHLQQNKLDPVSGATNNNFAALNADGKPIDSGKKASDFATASQGAKADKALQPVSGATANNFAALTSAGVVVDSGKKPSDFASAAQGSKADTAVQKAVIGGQTYTPSGGTLTVPGNAANRPLILGSDAKAPEANLPDRLTGSHNYDYGGKDLSTVFGSLAALHTAVAAGDFSKINVGDYWPITLNGSIKDYASGETKTLSNAIFKLEVAPQVYRNYGDTAVPNHLLMCSRDLLPWTLMYRSENTTWYDDTQTNPWLGSHLYQTLNAADGILPLVEAIFGSYMYAGPNGKGMRFLLETKAKDAANATGWGWGDRGKLFLPTEREVWGQDVWSEHSWGGGAAVQWPMFIGSLKHIIKGLGNGGSRYTWWCQSSRAGSAANFTGVYSNGFPGDNAATATWLSAPLCFLFV